MSGNPSLLVLLTLNTVQGTFFDFRIRDTNSPSSYGPPKQEEQMMPSYAPVYNRPSGPLDTLRNLKSEILRQKANALRFKGNLFYDGATALENKARPNYGGSYQSPSYQNPNTFQPPTATGAGTISDMMTGLGPDSIETIGDVRGLNNIDPGLMEQLQMQKLQKMRQNQILQGPKIQQCQEKLTQLVGDIFIGNEVVPDVLDKPPNYPLDLTYRTVRTFPGMRVTAETTRFKPLLHWPAEDGALYTVILSNLDINTRKNRTLAEFYHWFVANIPGDSVDDGDVIFDLLFPLVLPEGSGDHRFGYFVLKQPRALSYQEEGGPTDSCSPDMTIGRGPRRSTKDLMRKYDLELTAATFLIVESDETSLDIACMWQRCMGGKTFVRNLEC